MYGYPHPANRTYGGRVRMIVARRDTEEDHRDATMILIGYRHGLQASELCDLQRSQVELATGPASVTQGKCRSAMWRPL